MKTFFTCLFILLAVFSVRSQSPVVIELYTSQGCSSCPAADKLASRLNVESKNDNLIFLSFHVDYWNQLGYSDPYSKSEYTSRQRAYVNHMKLSSYYTPQAVVNGSIEFIGSNENRMRSEIRKALSQPYEKKIESAQAVLTDKKKIKINYKLKKIDSDERILIAYVLDHAQTKVGRGENSGLTLEETNLVSQLTSATNTLEGESFIYVTNTINVKNSHIVIFIQNHSTLQIRDAIKIPITPIE